MSSNVSTRSWNRARTNNLCWQTSSSTTNAPTRRFCCFRPLPTNLILHSKSSTLTARMNITTTSWKWWIFSLPAKTRQNNFSSSGNATLLRSNAPMWSICNQLSRQKTWRKNNYTAWCAARSVSIVISSMMTMWRMCRYFLRTFFPLLNAKSWWILFRKRILKIAWEMFRWSISNLRHICFPSWTNTNWRSASWKLYKKVAIKAVTKRIRCCSPSRPSTNIGL